MDDCFTDDFRTPWLHRNDDDIDHTFVVVDDDTVKHDDDDEVDFHQFIAQIISTLHHFRVFVLYARGS